MTDDTSDAERAPDAGAGPDPLELPFDQYQRYRLVADVVATLVPPGGSVLDVGGRTALLRSFLPEHRVALVDFEPSDARGLVQGDGSRLPFLDDSFDAVTACDTLEHVPPERRLPFARECARVSRGAVVLAGPYRHPPVDEAEEILLALVRGKLGIEHRYLEEHRVRGLPDLEETGAALAGQGARVKTIGHANLERWLALMSLALYMDEEPQLRKVARRYFRFYNQALYAADFEPPHYRHAVVGWFGKGSLDELLAGIGGPTAGHAAARPFRELVEELVAFDRERDVYEAERSRLVGVNDGLVKDLEGHRAVLAEAEREMAARAEVIAELRRDVSLLRPHADELERELQDAHRRLTELNEALRAKDQEVSSLRALLRGRLANLRRALSWKKPRF